MAEIMIPIRAELKESVHTRMTIILIKENLGKPNKKRQSEFIAELIEAGLIKKYGK